MTQNEPCVAASSSKQDDIIQCHICGKKFNEYEPMMTLTRENAVYICFETIRQKIFIYGKYTDGAYGALKFTQQFSKQECAEKKCEDFIKKQLESIAEEEYSRLVNCQRGLMEAVILTSEKIRQRKNDLSKNLLSDVLQVPESRKKYYCHEHALQNNFICQCGEKLIELGSEEHSRLTGMDDQTFIKKHVPQILSGQPLS